MNPQYLGGDKRNGGYFGYLSTIVYHDGKFIHGFRTGHNHIPMTKLERDRFFNRRNLQKGRRVR